MKFQLLLILIAFSFSECANILGIFHYPSYSHQIAFQKIVKDLSARGHHLTILTVNRINENFPNVTEIFMEDSYDGHNVNFAKSKEQKLSALKLYIMMYYKTITRTIHQLNNPSVKELINSNTKNSKFDLVILEYLYPHPMIYFAEFYDCPIVAISSMEVTNLVHNTIGNYVNYGLHPDHLFVYENGKLSLVQRLLSITVQTLISLALKPGLFIADLVFKQYFPNITRSFSEIESSRIEFLLQNSNPILGATRPITQNTILLGNLHLEPPKALKNDLKIFLDSSKNGVIYMSFGTNVNTNFLKNNTIPMFINTFKKLDFDILWKIDGNYEDILNSSSNIYASKWYPQADLLAHPNVKLFITHCGLMSLEEAIDREVPMIAIPFMFDQYQNAFKVRSEEIGLYLEYELLSEKILFNAIMEATQVKYKKNIQEFKKLMYDFPMQTREKAVWWIEYAIRNKGKNKLKYFGADIPFYQKYNLDIIVVLFLLILVLKKFLLIFRHGYVIKIKME